MTKPEDAYKHVEDHVDMRMTRAQEWIQDPTISYAGEVIPGRDERTDSYFDKLAKYSKPRNIELGTANNERTDVSLYGENASGSSLLLCLVYDVMLIAPNASHLHFPLCVSNKPKDPSFRLVMVRQGAPNAKRTWMALPNALHTMREVGDTLPVNVSIMEIEVGVTQLDVQPYFIGYNTIEKFLCQ